MNALDQLRCFKVIGLLLVRVLYYLIEDDEFYRELKEEFDLTFDHLEDKYAG